MTMLYELWFENCEVWISVSQVSQGPGVLALKKPPKILWAKWAKFQRLVCTRNFCEPRFCLLFGEVRRWSSGTHPRKNYETSRHIFFLCLIRGWLECLRTQEEKLITLCFEFGRYGARAPVWFRKNYGTSRHVIFCWCFRGYSARPRNVFYFYFYFGRGKMKSTSREVS